MPPPPGATRQAGTALVKALDRHLVIRSALRFFLHSWQKQRHVGAAPNAMRVMSDYLRFQSVYPTKEALKTQPTLLEFERSRRGGGSGGRRDG